MRLLDHLRYQVSFRYRHVLHTPALVSLHILVHLELYHIQKAYTPKQIYLDIEIRRNGNYIEGVKDLYEL